MSRGYPDYRYFSFPVSVAEGGTGVGSLTLYGVLLGNGTSQIIASAAGNPYEVLRVPNIGGFPAFGAVDVGQGAAVAGVLPVAHGGTGTATGSITGTGALTFTAGGTGQNITLDAATSGGSVIIPGVTGGASSILEVGRGVSGQIRIQDRYNAYGDPWTLYKQDGLYFWRGTTAFGIDDATHVITLEHPLPITSGGTGTATGSIQGSGELHLAAGGVDQHVYITPSGAGAVLFPQAYVESSGNYVSGSGLFMSYDGDVELRAGGAGPHNVILTPAGAGKVTTTKQIETTLATGTAPLAVTSTTLVTNLNAERVAGTRVTNAATSGALLIGSGAGTAAWGTPDGARVYNSANQSIADKTTTALTFDSERYDNGGLHSTTSNTSRLTAQKAGKYYIWANVQLAANATGLRTLTLRRNGTTGIANLQRQGLSSPPFTETISTIAHLAAADYVEVTLYQDSGVSLSTGVYAEMFPEFAMQWLGP